MPGPRIIAGPEADGVDPALQLDVVGQSESFPEARGDPAAPTPGAILRTSPTSSPIMALPFSADHLGAHLVGDTGGDEELDVDVLAGLGPQDRDLGVGKPLWRSGIRRRA